MTHYTLGVDPGKKGGLAILKGDFVEAIPMPIAGKAIDWHAAAEWLTHVAPVPGDIRAFVEKVHAMPTQGVKSMFTFGASYGGVFGMLGALGVSVELVTPQRWKNRILRDTKKGKDDAVDYCRHRWPTVSLLATDRSRKPHDGMAEALCIAAYGEGER